MPKVLVVCEYPTLYGGERSLLAVLDRLAHSWAESPFRFIAAAPPVGPLADALSARGVPLIPLVLHDSAGRRLPLEVGRQRLRDIVADLAPDLLHANSLSMARLSGPVADRFNLPSIGHIRDIVRISNAAVADVNRHTRLLAVSTATRTFHVDRGIDSSKTSVLYNGVDLEQFRPRRPRGFLHRELGLPRGAPLIGGMGQLGVRKGWDIFLAAAARITARRPDVRFVIAGQRSSTKSEAVLHEQQLRRSAAGRRLGRRMIFLGPRNDASRLLNELTILAHPARQEPLGRVLLEGAASGLAIVATDVGGAREILPPATWRHSLTSPENPAQLADRLAALLADPLLRRRVGRRLRNRAESRFAAHQAALQLLEHYRQVLNGRG